MEAKLMEQLMKRILFLTLVGIAIATVSAAAAQTQTQSQTLGDYARAVKKTKPASVKSSKTYDNDNLPNSGKLSVVGAAQPEAAAENDNKDPGKDVDAKANPADVKVGQSSEDREKAIADWRQKIDDQNGKVDLASRELDVLKRELEVKRADFYSSTARAVQNPRGFDEEEAKYKQQLADKQKVLDDAKAKLNDLQEQARKSGVPNSAAE
jgi:hypothetical protein